MDNDWVNLPVNCDKVKSVSSERNISPWTWCNYRGEKTDCLRTYKYIILQSDLYNKLIRTFQTKFFIRVLAVKTRVPTYIKTS